MSKQTESMNECRPCIMGCGLGGREEDGFCGDACRGLYYKEKDEQFTMLRKQRIIVDGLVDMITGGAK